MTEFQTGDIYFMVWYFDDEKVILSIDSLVFVGCNLEEEELGRDAWYFQDTESYAQGGVFTKGEVSGGNVYVLHEEDLYQVIDANQLVTEITEWCARR